MSLLEIQKYGKAEKTDVGFETLISRYGELLDGSGGEILQSFVLGIVGSD